MPNFGAQCVTSVNKHIFTRCNLRQVNFSGAVLKSCQFIKCQLPEAMPSVIATISSTTITDCPDELSLACAKLFFHQQLQDMPDGEDKRHFELSYARCLATSGDESGAHTQLSTLPVSAEYFAEYVLALAESHYITRLDQLADDPQVLQLVQPETYAANPAVTLLNAEVMYIVLLRNSMFTHYKELRRDLLNMLAICPVGFTPYCRKTKLEEDSAYACLRDLKCKEQVASLAERQYQVHLLKCMSSKGIAAVWVDKDHSCFYRALSYHFLSPTSRLNPKDNNWMKQLLAFLFYGFLSRKEGESGYEPSVMPETPYAELNQKMQSLSPLTEDQYRWIEQQLSRESTSAGTIYNDLLRCNIWGATDFANIAAILLRRPIYLFHPYFLVKTLRITRWQRHLLHLRGLLQRNHGLYLRKANPILCC